VEDVLDRGISGLDAMRGEDQKRVEELIMQVLNLLALLFTCFTIYLLYYLLALPVQKYKY